MNVGVNTTLTPQRWTSYALSVPIGCMAILTATMSFRMAGAASVSGTVQCQIT